jgi:hypothetical protein
VVDISFFLAQVDRSMFGLYCTLQIIKLHSRKLVQHLHFYPAFFSYGVTDNVDGNVFKIRMLKTLQNSIDLSWNNMQEHKAL